MKSVYRPAPVGGIILYTTVIFLAAPVFLVIFGMASSFAESLPSYIIAGICVVADLYSWLGKPARYEVTDDAVTIIMRRPFRGRKIPVQRIEEVFRTSVPFACLNDTCGFGFFGVFSTTAKCWSKRLGSFQAAVTNPEQAILITADKKYVISPRDPDAFIADVRSRMTKECCA